MFKSIVKYIVFVWVGLASILYGVSGFAWFCSYLVAQYGEENVALGVLGIVITMLGAFLGVMAHHDTKIRNSK